MTAGRVAPALLTPALLIATAQILGACRPAPAAVQTPAPPVTLRVLTRQATLSSTRPLAAGLPWSLTCELASGPLRREGLGQGVPLAEVLDVPESGVFGCEAQVGGRRVAVAAETEAPLPPPIQTRPPPAPSAVASGTLQLDPPEIRIGRREPWILRADLRGVAGQPVPDGTLVTLLGQGPEGETLDARRITVNGEATWRLLPERAGRWTLRVSAGTWTTAVSARARSALLGGVPGLLWAGETLTLGPLLWADGALPDDGTPVDVQALDANSGALWSARARTVLGRVTMEVPDVPGARTLRIQVAGAESSVPWSRP